MGSARKRALRTTRDRFKCDLYEKAVGNPAFALVLAETANTFIRNNDLRTIWITMSKTQPKMLQQLTNQIQNSIPTDENNKLFSAMVNITNDIKMHDAQEYGLWHNLALTEPLIYEKYHEQIPINYAIGDTLGVIHFLNDYVLDRDDE